MRQHNARGGLRSLLEALPDPMDIDKLGDGDLKARAALALIVERAIVQAKAAGDQERTPADPFVCANCGAQALSDRSPYCGDPCRMEAAFVRQMRNGISSGSIMDEARQIAHGEKLWRVLGGGYPRRQGLVSERAREKIFAREKGACQTCGAPATTIDQTGSG